MILPERFKIEFAPYTLRFKEPGGTSRGVLTEKKTYFIRIKDLCKKDMTGYGEIPIFKGLSEESEEELLIKLHELCNAVNESELPVYNRISSLCMGMETAAENLSQRKDAVVFPSEFTDKKRAITINGLIWMGNYAEMERRVKEKLKNEFGCIKLKIGAINWEDEIRLIKYIRNIKGNDIIIRVDANGAFGERDCMMRLEMLAKLNVHSIEQPIKKGNYKLMKYICCHSPIPVALDEELIGIPTGDERTELLEYLRPQFLVLKPALCYGFSGSSDWIKRAESLGIGWWITSALESSIGLNAIAQFTGKLDPSLPQGLGTGNLFTDNLPSTVALHGDKLSYTGPDSEYIPALEALNWQR